MKNLTRLAAVFLMLAVFFVHPAWALDTERLSGADIKDVKNLILKLTPLIQEREKKKQELIRQHKAMLEKAKQHKRKR